MSASPSAIGEKSSAGILQPVLAGVLAAIVGYASTFTLVLAGLQAVGATAAEAGSGLLSVSLAVAILNFAAALLTRQPLSIAWSTPGAAFLLTAGVPPEGFPAAVGALLMAAALIVLVGLWKPFSRAIAAIPSAIANAMLAGILLTLCLAPVRAVEQVPLQALPIIAAWVLGLIFARRYAVPIAVAVTAVVLTLSAKVPPDVFVGAWPSFTFVAPVFTIDAFLRLSVPVFIVTMASQNLPGLAVMKANGYEVDPARPLIATGVASALIAPLAGITVNLAAITAAIAAGPESHPDPARRWIAPFAASWVYLGLALMASLAAAFIAASPPILIQAVAGLALFTSLAGALAAALAADDSRLPAILTFVTAASGVSILGIGAAFWGLVAGIALLIVLRPRRRPSP